MFNEKCSKRKRKQYPRFPRAERTIVWILLRNTESLNCFFFLCETVWYNCVLITNKYSVHCLIEQVCEIVNEEMSVFVELEGFLYHERFNSRS